ncbi:hypothetical protein T11_4446 [Trichinella zimbabwensis]|uniref:Uncharacterized protein n=1 Tax=Trichinella zimbabwensis TaxID=268475 RepID=A0A0V1HBJ4_9BILA|nr:hypothetical protein T11_4446 [Trichinella zimbabwensis]
MNLNNVISPILISDSEKNEQFSVELICYPFRSCFHCSDKNVDRAMWISRWFAVGEMGFSEMNRRFHALYRADFCCVSKPCPSYSINQHKMSIASAIMLSHHASYRSAFCNFLFTYAAIVQWNLKRFTLKRFLRLCSMITDERFLSGLDGFD